MQSLYCSNCGAPIESNLKFCRKCGHAVNHSEATTRTLDPPSVVEPSTQHINSMPTAPSYLPPEMMQPIPAPSTTGLRQDGQKRTVIVLASLVGFLLIALVALGIISFYLTRSGPPAPIPPPPPREAASRGGIPPPPVPPVPPVPPAPVIGTSAISREFVYPGAEITMEVNGDEGGSVVQLRTTDPLEKVVAWYKEKLKPVKTVNMIGPLTVLRGEGMAAVITGGADGVSVVLKQEREKN